MENESFNFAEFVNQKLASQFDVKPVTHIVILDGAELSAGQEVINQFKSWGAAFDFIIKLHSNGEADRFYSDLIAGAVDLKNGKFITPDTLEAEYNEWRFEALQEQREAERDRDYLRWQHAGV